MDKTTQYYVYISLFVFSKALIVFLFINSSIAGTGWRAPLLNPVMGDFTRSGPILIYSSLYLFLIISLMNQKILFKFVKNFMHKYFFLFIICALYLIWSLLSYDFYLNMRRSIAILFSTMVGIYIGEKLEIYDQMKILKNVLFIIFFISIVFIFFTDIGVNTGPIVHGSWRGVYHYKNDFGLVMSLFIFLLLCFASHQHILFKKFQLLDRSFLLLIIGALTFSVYMSQSVTAILVTIVTFICYMTLFIVRIDRTAIPFLFFLGSISVMFLSFHLIIYGYIEDVLLLFGKDMTLTTRTYLWEAVLSEAFKNPLIGYGASGFWTGPWMSSVWSEAGWDPSYAHNGYVELFVSAGIFGVLFMIVIIVEYFRNSFFFIKNSKYPYTVKIWPIIFVVFLLVSNFVENMFPQENSLYWIVFVSSYASLKRFKSEYFINHLKIR